MAPKKMATAAASKALVSSAAPLPSSAQQHLHCYPLKAGLIDIGVNLTDTMYQGFYNHNLEKRVHPADLDLVVDRAVAMGVVGLIITGGNLEESQHAVDLAIAQNKRLREKQTHQEGHAKKSVAAATSTATAAGAEAEKKTEGCAEGETSAVVAASSSHPFSSSASPTLKCYATVGCHPTRSSEMKRYKHKKNQTNDGDGENNHKDEETEGEGGVLGYISGLRQIIKKHSVRNISTSGGAGGSGGGGVDADSCVVVAIGECGLDYDRLHFSGKADQLVGFEAQFTLAKEFQLPMFLHNRNTGDDFSTIVKKHKANGTLDHCGGGVVHSFTGDAKELDELLGLGLYIGINGCSMKTNENLDVVRKVPLDRLMLETDGPWCEIKPTHDSFQFLKDTPAAEMISSNFKMFKKEKFVLGSLVKSRYEPAQMVEVLEVVFQLRKDEPEVAGDREKLAALVRKNTEKVFPLH